MLLSLNSLEKLLQYCGPPKTSIQTFSLRPELETNWLISSIIKCFGHIKCHNGRGHDLSKKMQRPTFMEADTGH